MKNSIEIAFSEAKALERNGNISLALKVYEGVVDRFPANVRAKKAISRLRSIAAAPSQTIVREIVNSYKSGHFQRTLAITSEQLIVFPNSEQLWTLRGAAATALGQHALAENAFRQSVRLMPQVASTYFNLGAALESQGNYIEAVESFTSAIELSPKQAGYYPSRGNAHRSAGDLKAAIADLRTSTKLDTGNAIAFGFLGQYLQEYGETRSAIDAFKSAILLDPNSPAMHLNLGDSYHEAGDIPQALKHLERATVLDPNNSSAHNNLASAYFSARQYDASLLSCMAAIALNPDYARAYHNIANVHHRQGRLDLAVAAYGTAVSLDDSMHVAQTLKLHFQAQMCDWQAQEEFETVANTIGITGKAVPPWPLLGFEDHPERQKLRSGQYAKQWQNNRADLTGSPTGSRIRVGYFSSDLCEHATLFLLNGVIENHNQADFEIIVYCMNEPKRSPQLDRLIRNAEHFVDVHLASDDDIVKRARQDELDIAIDLKGYTQDARTGPFSAGLAPIQISYLGYPGTMATPCMDYLIADTVVVPPEQREHYSEQLIYLPDSYQPNDDHRIIAQAPVSRASCGLPEDAVVLCCFNSSYKITPQEFDIWMRILSSVPKAVLWLLDGNEWAKDNLKQAARDRGVDETRLIFAENLPHDAHLARHRLADIFVDTFNVNAHTTASDALWTGLPVVTKAGSQFAARVAASLLKAVGMADLITEDAQQYENLITKLATDKAALLAVKSRLRANLATTPLFDTAAYTAHLEEGYRQVWQRWQQGWAPQDVHVQSTPKPN
ncbi:tetratricopeptide repeat protein [Parasedimentitalea psychrophila]|uniref:protein O-GlcNAc transferase n=1 Tax=Parasedimentitalea psychrophila TaxID=2997337 RepID=A0A9Y2L0L4_9RHOB|nr:tetratricopeptide repeat protein [Parasedimentitalea psychrophila]WIY25780.1 tetratricopeptide repeat protein [Parasedimentitalea psychrophila]